MKVIRSPRFGNGGSLTHQLDFSKIENLEGSKNGPIVSLTIDKGGERHSEARLVFDEDDLEHLHLHYIKHLKKRIDDLENQKAELREALIFNKKNWDFLHVLDGDYFDRNKRNLVEKDIEEKFDISPDEYHDLIVDFSGHMVYGDFLDEYEEFPTEQVKKLYEKVMQYDDDLYEID